MRCGDVGGVILSGKRFDNSSKVGYVAAIMDVMCENAVFDECLWLQSWAVVNECNARLISRSVSIPYIAEE